MQGAALCGTRAVAGVRPGPGAGKPGPLHDEFREALDQTSIGALTLVALWLLRSLEGLSDVLFVVLKE